MNIFFHGENMVQDRNIHRGWTGLIANLLYAGGKNRQFERIKPHRCFRPSN
jgi:hypothetical protein